MPRTAETTSFSGDGAALGRMTGDLAMPVRVPQQMWSVRPDAGPDELHARIVEIGGDGPSAWADVPPVVFLHGLVGLNDHWEEVVRRIQHRVRCVLFELPLLRLEGDDCSITGVTHLTARFLREYVGGPSILVGNSFGGHVALRLGIAEQGLVHQLVLAGSSGLIEKSIVADIQIRPSRAWLAKKIGELFYDQANMRESDLDRAHAELSERHGARAMVKLSRSARRDVLRGQVGQITAPTLLLWGKQDIVTPPEAAEGFAEQIKGSRLVWFDRCGHVPMIEAPDQFAEEMLEFLDAHRPSRA